MSVDTYTLTHETMGTVWDITIHTISEKTFKEISQIITHYLDSFNSDYSRFRKDSLVAEMSVKTGRMVVPHECVEMLKIYEKLAALTNNVFNPFIGNTLSDLGYDSDYSLQEKDDIRPTPGFHDALEIVDDCTIYIHEPVLIDFGAIGKGFVVDTVSRMISKHGYSSVVDGSGDMKNFSDSILKVGLEDPHDVTKIIGSLHMGKTSLASSSGNRRFWRGKHEKSRHHIIDGQSYESPDFIHASWVLHESCAVADALATALFLAPPEIFIEEFDFDYILMNKDRKVKKSTGFDVQLYS